MELSKLYEFYQQNISHKSYYDTGKYILVDLSRELCDQRVVDSYWLIQNGMLYPVLIGAAYLLFCLVSGPWLMRNREPFSLKWPMLIYNLSMAMANFYFLLRFVVISRFGLALFDFAAPDPGDWSEMTMKTIQLNNIYWLSKYLDFFDSIFFVLRKKFVHLSFLHLYHHSTVAVLGTGLFMLYPTGKIAGPFILLNSLIHTVMYSYYGLAALGPQMQPYLWWKRYITQIQIVQFVIYIVYLIPFSLYQTGYSPYLLTAVSTQAPFFLYLFVRFYQNAYNRSKTIANNKKNL